MPGCVRGCIVGKFPIPVQQVRLNGVAGEARHQPGTLGSWRYWPCAYMACCCSCDWLCCMPGTGRCVRYGCCCCCRGICPLIAFMPLTLCCCIGCIDCWRCCCCCCCWCPCCMEG